MKRLFVLFCLLCAACAGHNAPSSSAIAGSKQFVSLDVHTGYFELNGKQYHSADQLASAAKALPADASVLVKSSLNGTTPQTRKVLDDKTSAAVAALQKAGVKNIMIKQSITLRS